MTKKLLILLFISSIVFSCKSKKGVVTKKDRSRHKTERVVSSDHNKTEEELIVEEVAADVDMSVRKFKNATEQYIYDYKDIAIREMQKYKIPASITLAQGILESGSGKGRLAVEANNHFGIKCHDWNGKKIYHDDDASQECFRKYEHAMSSYEDHSQFLTGRSRYAKLFQLRDGDYKSWAKELRAAGYATDRQYPEKLITLIERYELYRYDAKVLNNENLAYLDDKEEIAEVEAIEAVTYKVRKGDTLYSLSRRYNTSVENLKNLNRLSSTDLSVGQVLIIKSN